MRQASLSLDGIDFAYRRRGALVLSSLTWAVPVGRTVLLGPNGAGKTTLLALAAAALSPRHGVVRLGSLDPARRRDRATYLRSVGYMPQTVHAVPGFSCREQVTYSAWLKGMPTGEAWEAAARALEAVDLTEQAGRRTTELSGGQLQRVGLAQALVHDASVLLLDEPTAGLDPEQRARFRDCMAGIPPDRTIVVSTHQVDDLSSLYDTVVVMEAGRIRWQGALPAFLSLVPPTAERRAEAAYMSIVNDRSR